MKKIIISSILILFLLSGVADAATIIIEDADQTWNLTLNDTNFNLTLNPRIKLEYVDSLDYIWNSKLNSTPTDLNNSINSVKPRIKLEYVDSLDYIWNSKLITFQSENRRPVANAGGPYYGNVNELIQFYGSGTDYDGDAIVGYAWDFDGDGVIDSTLQRPTHSWSVAGTFYPTLKVQDERGTWSEWDWCDVHVYDPNPHLGPYPLSVFDKYYIRIFNIDDIGKAYVNGKLVSSVNFGQDSGLIDITDDLHLGDNEIHLTVKNLKEGYTYGFDIIHDDGTLEICKWIWHESCGDVGVYGCNDNEQTGEKIVYDKTITLELEEREFSDFSFVQVTDVHIGYDQFSVTPAGDTRQSVEKFTEIINGINELNPKPKFVLITGDLVEFNKFDFFYKFMNVLANLDSSIRFYHIPGNHDRRTRYFGDDNLKNYHDCISVNGPIDGYLIGRDNYTFEDEGYLFIGLDSGKDFNATIGDEKWDETPEGAGLSYEQLYELVSLDETRKSMPKIIFMHHPAINEINDASMLSTLWPPVPPNGPGGNDACIAKYRAFFIKYCTHTHYNVQLVLTGHTHEDKILNAKGKPVSVYSHDRPLFIQTRSATKDEFLYGFRRISVNASGAHPYPSELNIVKFKRKTVWVSGLGNTILHAYDSEGRHTGMDENGNVVREIPETYYIGNYGGTPNLEGIIFYDPDEDYKLTVTLKNGSIVPLTTKELQMQTSENELFNLSITNQTEDYLTTISYYNVTITENTTATVKLNKTMPNYTMEIDYDGDEITDETKDPDSIETNYAPTATIISPENNSIIVHGDEITFTGTGTDPEDGILANSSLVWASDIYGIIGIGNEFNTYNLSPGRHNITLRVNDSAGLIGTDSMEIQINAPDLTLNSSDILFSNPNPAAGEIITINATIRNIGLINATNVNVQFYDGILEFQISNVTISTIRAGESGTVNATWDTTGKMGKHSISVAIDLDDSIEEMNETNNQASKSVVVNENHLPIANFTYTPGNPDANQTITFNASSSYDPDGNITDYEWDFGDGNTTNTTESIINHSYALAGNYNVSLTVTDNDGATNLTLSD